ncbi:hypothetical protein ABVT39_024043 [Epinephelus coioides]
MRQEINVILKLQAQVKTKEGKLKQLIPTFYLKKRQDCNIVIKNPPHISETELQSQAAGDAIEDVIQVDILLMEKFEHGGTKEAAALIGDVRPSGDDGRRAVEDVAGLLKVLLRERLAAVPDRLGMEGQMVFD